jgi:hypothetical protein
LSDIDLVFVEEAFERLMLDYDRVFSGASRRAPVREDEANWIDGPSKAIHTPACLWRRTGEIYKANREFAMLTGIPAGFLRGGKLGIYQLMTEESAIKYYEVRRFEALYTRVGWMFNQILQPRQNLASIAFDAGKPVYSLGRLISS